MAMSTQGVGDGWSWVYSRIGCRISMMMLIRYVFVRRSVRLTEGCSLAMTGKTDTRVTDLDMACATTIPYHLNYHYGHSLCLYHIYAYFMCAHTPAIPALARVSTLLRSTKYYEPTMSSMKLNLGALRSNGCGFQARSSNG